MFFMSLWHLWASEGDKECPRDMGGATVGPSAGIVALPATSSVSVSKLEVVTRLYRIPFCICWFKFKKSWYQKVVRKFTGRLYSVASSRASSRQSGCEKGRGPLGNICSMYFLDNWCISGQFICCGEEARHICATTEKCEKLDIGLDKNCRL